MLSRRWLDQRANCCFFIQSQSCPSTLETIACWPSMFRPWNSQRNPGGEGQGRVISAMVSGRERCRVEQAVGNWAIGVLVTTQRRARLSRGDEITPVLAKTNFIPQLLSNFPSSPHQTKYFTIKTPSTSPLCPFFPSPPTSVATENATLRVNSFVHQLDVTGALCRMIVFGSWSTTWDGFNVSQTTPSQLENGNGSKLSRPFITNSHKPSDPALGHIPSHLSYPPSPPPPFPLADCPTASINCTNRSTNGGIPIPS